MRRIVLAAAAALVLPAPAFAQIGGWDPNELSKARSTVEEFKEKDSGIGVYFEQAYAYAVYPSIGKAAFIVGGAHGNGTVFRNDEPIGRTSLTQASVGLSAGAQAFAEIVFFQNERAFERFKSGNLELAAQASAVVVTQGASTNVAYEGGVAVFTMPRGGAMLEASVGGQKFTFQEGSGN